MRLRNQLMFCCLMLAFPPTVKAQYLRKPVRILTTKDGLPQSFVSGLVQDKEGFIWIGTRNGLARYDGIHFKQFQHNSKDSASLSSNLIISLKIDKRNRIWVEHESGDIDCFDPVEETVERVTRRPLNRLHPGNLLRRGWMADTAGNLWCINQFNGLDLYDWKKNQVSHFTKATKHLLNDTIIGLLEDHRGQIWVASQRGISRIEPSGKNCQHFLFPFQLQKNGTISFHERKNGEFILGYPEKLILFNPDRVSFRTVPLPSKNATSPIQSGPDGADYLESLGTVYRYDDTHGLVPVGRINEFNLRLVQSFLVDRSGLIWLGPNGAGLQQIDLSAPLFESHPNNHFFQHDLLQQQSGFALDRFIDWPLTDPFYSWSGYYFRSAYDARHRLWIGISDRVGYYDPLQKKWIALPPVPGLRNKSDLAFGIRGISFSPDGRLWVISTDRNVIVNLDTVQQRWTHFFHPGAFDGINTAFVDVQADTNKLWISSNGEGLICIDLASKQISALNQKTKPGLLPTDILLGMLPDPARPELLWIGSYEGLICFNKKTLATQVFSVQQGLPDNTIYSIQADKEGFLWLSTNKGLCRFHPVTHQVRTFQTQDGLPNDEFNRFHHLKLPDGRLAFGGADGWVLFDPATIRPDTYFPPVAFTGLQINNERVTYTIANGLLPAPLNHLTELSLPYDQNTLTFEFAGLEFNQPSKILYRYQLKGYNDDWIVTATPIVNYTKLPPGHYTLKVNATNTTGQWSSHVRTLPLVIMPPWWQTWWAYGLYGLSLAGLIWAYVQYRLNRERLRQEVTLKEREAVQLKVVDELKTRFFSNITHEFRTPLTLILAPAQRLKSALQNSDHLRWLDAIERNSHHLLGLINQLLDFSRLESGTLQVHEAIGNINTAIKEMLHPFCDEAETNGIRLLFKTGLGNDGYWFDADKLEQIIGNLVGNALKFTHRDGEVEVAVYSGNAESVTNYDADRRLPDNSSDGIWLTISDTGIGIPPSQLISVFNRFYQVHGSDARYSKGSGIGLSLVKELVELQGGTIRVNSPGKDEGRWHTTFIVWLPYRVALSNDPSSTGETGCFSAMKTIPGYQPNVLVPATVVEEEKETASILLIEDNAELADFIADVLPKSYGVSLAANGAEGLEMAFSRVPDIVISDVLMPVMDGYECCKKLKEDERTSHIPVILLTAKATFDSRIEGLVKGADDYLTKPFHIQELQLRVHNLLDRQRRIREQVRKELSLPGLTAILTPSKPSDDLQNAFIRKLHALVEENLDDVDFGVEELASHIGMSRTNLHRKLKAVTGLPSGDVIRHYRLKRAAQFLKEGFNSSETAYRAGFSSPPYFSKCFRDFYQVTPLEFVQRGQ